MAPVYCIYMYCRYQTTDFIIEINRLAPKPFALVHWASIRTYTVGLASESETYSHFSVVTIFKRFKKKKKKKRTEKKEYKLSKC